MTATTVNQMKCACEKCLCVVTVGEGAIEKDGQYYCSDACASGHADGQGGCGHTGCNC